MTRATPLSRRLRLRSAIEADNQLADLLVEAAEQLEADDTTLREVSSVFWNPAPTLAKAADPLRRAGRRLPVHVGSRLQGTDLWQAPSGRYHWQRGCSSAGPAKDLRRVRLTDDQLAPLLVGPPESKLCPCAARARDRAAARVEQAE